MLSAVFSTATEIVKSRWKPITGAVLLGALLLGIAFMLLVMPAVKGLVPQGAAMAQPTDVTGQLTTLDPTTGMPIATPAPGSTMSIDGPGPTEFAKVFLGILACVLIGIVMTTAGVFAAAGSGAVEAIRQAVRALPVAFVQLIRITWPAAASIVVAIFAGAMGPVGLVVAVPAMLFAAYWWLRVFGMATMVLAAIAHGHDGWSPAAVRDAVGDRAWTATGVTIVGSVAAAGLGAIPGLGIIFQSAFSAAMWQEFSGEDGGGPGHAGGPLEPSSGAAVRSMPHELASTPVHATPLAVAAAVADVPQAQAEAAEAAQEPVPATPFSPGPTWAGQATPEAPLGQWVQAARPARACLQVQWVDGAAPGLHLADQAGTWSQPSAQPGSSGDPVYLDLPAGWTWVALVSPAPQQLWVTSWLPADAAVPAA